MPDASKSDQLPPGLRRWAESQLGPLAEVRDLSWPHGESAVWLLAGGGGRAVLKHYRQRRKFEQELRAYRQWLPRLETDVRVPSVIAAREGEPRALLLAEMPGAPLDTLSLPTGAEQELYARAGSFLRSLHRLPLADDDPVPLVDALSRRLHSWSARARGLVPAHVVDAVGKRVEESLPALVGVRRVPCHRDYTARNWLVEPDGAALLTVIDFEHSRPDLWLLDLERLWSGTFLERPDLAEAFFGGYGQALGPEEEALLARLAALAALGTVAWAREHGDAAFEQRGWATLRRLGLVADIEAGSV